MLCVSLLIVSLDNTILNIALPTLVRALRATTTQLQWIVDAYAVVFAGLLLVAGSVGDRVGRKVLFIAGLVIFGAGSAGSAFSGSVDTLIVARGVAGIGAACIMPATLAIISDVFRSAEERGRAIGIWSGTTGLGIAIGPIAGGWLLAHYWWGSVFLINVPVCVAGITAALLVVPNSRDPDPRPVDVTGAFLSMAGLSALLWAIIEAPVRGWGSPEVLLVGAGSLVVLAGFVLWERHSAHPMLVLEPFGNRRFSVAIAAVGLAVFALMGTLFVLTQYLQFSLGYSPLAAGIRILPVGAILAVTAVASSALDKWLGTKVLITVALLIVAAGLWQLATTTTAEGFGHALVGMLLLGAGAGVTIAPATACVIGALPRARAGVGSATNSTALQLGGALGVGVMGSLLATRYQGRMTLVLAGHSIPSAAEHAILGSIGGALAVARVAGGTLGALLAAAARHAFVDGMDLALVVGAGVVGLSAVLVLVALPNRAPPGVGADADDGGHDEAYDDGRG